MDHYASYMQPDENGGLLSTLAQANEWLCSEEGEDALKSTYVARGCIQSLPHHLPLLRNRRLDQIHGDLLRHSISTWAKQPPQTTMRKQPKVVGGPRRLKCQSGFDECRDGEEEG